MFEDDDDDVIVSTELMSQSKILPYFTKAKNRSHFAALLVEKLIDEKSRIKSNVHGKSKKEQLDPVIIQ